MIGRTLAQFRIDEQIGSGGMGVVYRAHDERLHREVALKFLPQGALSNESARKIFHREALALSHLNHPGIATVHDFQTADGIDFLVMEYIPGQSLDERLQSGPLPEPEVVAIGVQLAEGLAEAHRRGVIHRDLKPGNLRMTPDGRLKILDFGLAQWLGPESQSSATVTATDPHSVAGTPAYIAPELLMGSPASERSDLYGAGLVLYEAATGQRPFPGLPTGALLEAVLNQKPPSPRSRNPAISPGLESVILRCMEKDPGRRYGSASELSDDLKRLSGASGPAPRAAPPRLRVVALALAMAALGLAGAYWVWRSAGPVPFTQASKLRSLAVLPLGNLSGDPEQDYFAEGMTEELISQLSSVQAIRVTSLTSVMRYRGTKRSMPEIGRELGVDDVIEGNVLKSGGRLRTTVHLIAAGNDTQLWSGHYDGDTTDVLGLQSRVAEAIVHEIRVRLTPEERAHLAETPRVDPDAYQFYLRGRYQWNRRSNAGILLAIDYFQKAIGRDSLYAPAHAGLSDALSAVALYGMQPPSAVRDKAMAEARRAVALAPALSEGHTSLGHILHNFDWDWDGAEREYRTAIELNPSNATAHYFYAFVFAQRGQLDAARRELRKARDLDPLSVTTLLADATVEYYAGRNEQALEHMRRAAELDSANALLHRLNAAVLDREGREAEAVAELARYFELQGHPEMGAALTRAYRAAGMNGAIELLIGALLRKRAAGAFDPPEHIAELYARLGRKEEAFHWLQVALEARDPELNRLRVDPIFTPLRSDPRYAELLERVGLGDRPPGR